MNNASDFICCQKKIIKKIKIKLFITQLVRELVCTYNYFYLIDIVGHVRRQEYDPCTYDYSVLYFNRPEVQKAMHANVSGMIAYPWAGCSDTLFVNWKDSAATVLPIYQELLKAGLRLWVFR